VTQIVCSRRFAVLDEVVDLRAPDELAEVVSALYADAPATTAETTLSLHLASVSQRFTASISSGSISSGDRQSADKCEQWCDTPSELYEVLQRELTYALLTHLAPRYLLVHAGAVQLGSTAVLLPGGHDSGKSSLALELGHRGQFFSDDVTPIHPQTLSAMSFQRELVLHTGTRSAHRPLPRPARCSRFEEYDYLAARQADLTWASPTRVGALVFPHRRQGYTAQMATVTPAESARRLLEQCFDLQRLGATSTDVVIDLAECPAVDVWFDRADQIAPMLLEWVQSARPAAP
jgi:hypothetical protein